MTSKRLRRLVHRLNRRFASAVADLAAQLSHALHGRAHRHQFHFVRLPRRARH
jgi:hypothetical protein